MKKIVAFLLKHEYLIWILCLCALLRLPSLLEPYWYGDEGIYLTLGNGIRHGLILYRDIHDNKPPLIYLMAAITGSVFWFRFFLLVWNSIAIVAFERLSRILLQEDDNDGTIRILGVKFPIPRFSTIATLLFATVPFFAEGAIANGEIFMIMPVIVGMYLLWRKISFSHVVAAGTMFAIAFLIKVPSLFDAFAAGWFFCVMLPLFAFQKHRRISLKKIANRYARIAAVFIAAFALPIVLSFIFYASKGVGKQYVAAAFAQNIGYLSSWATGTHAASNVGSSGLKNRAMVFFVALIVIALLSKKNGKRMTFLLIWFTSALFGALLAERPYPHYLIQVIPPAILLIVCMLQNLRNRSEQLRSDVIMQSMSAAVAIGLLIYSIVAIKFWYYPLLPYYENYVSFVLHRKTTEQYFAYFDPTLPAMYDISTQIQSHTKPDDRIFVWGDYPMIYALTRRLPPGRYTSSYHIIDFHGFDETTQALMAHEPKYIVIDTRYQTPYPGLSGFMMGRYAAVSTSSPFILYRRISL